MEIPGSPTPLAISRDWSIGQKNEQLNNGTAGYQGPVKIIEL